MVQKSWLLRSKPDPATVSAPWGDRASDRPFGTSRRDFEAERHHQGAMDRRAAGWNSWNRNRVEPGLPFLKGHGLKREVPGKKNNGFSYEKRWLGDLIIEDMCLNHDKMVSRDYCDLAIKHAEYLTLKVAI